MKFACPKCGDGVGFGDRVCAKCGLPLSLGSLLGFYKGAAAESVRERAVIKCPAPDCSAIIPLSSKECPKCKTPITVETALAPTQQRIQGMMQKPDRKFLRRVQLFYFLLSVGALIGLLSYIENQADWNLVQHGLMAILYLAVFGVLLRLFVRPEKVRLLLTHFSPLVKFTLFFNYLTLVLVLQVGIGTWWKKASILGGVFVGTLIAIYVLAQYVWPLTMEVQNWFAGPPPPAPFNPGDPQGRTIKTDHTSR